MYSKKEFDRAFMMFHDLKNGRKPGFFTHPYYKPLYNHALKYQIISEYDQYFEDLPNMNDLERDERAIKLTNYVYK